MFSHLLLLLAASAVPADTAHLVIVATTDVHGRAPGWDYTTDRSDSAGLVRVATVVDSLRRQYPGQVLLFDSGDLIQGDPFAAYFARVAPRDTNPIVQAMNLIGYDAATVGNHEFNWGLETLSRAVRGATFAYVSANVVGQDGKPVYQPSVTITRNGVRIGVTGFTTPGVMIWDRANVANRVRVTRVLPAANRILRSLTRNSDLTIALIHSGMDGPASYDTTGVGDENVAAELASLKVTPDLVIVGHSHREMRDSVINGVHFVQPRNWARSVTVMHVDLVREGSRWRPVAWRGELVPLQTVAPEARVAAALAGAHDAVRAWITTPLATLDSAMPAAFARAGPTPIINLIHAVQLARTGAEISVASAFNLEGGFPAGSVRLSDVASIYPYENTLRAIRISGAQLRQYLEHSARYYQRDSTGRLRTNPDMPGYNFDMIAGAYYRLNLDAAPGHRVEMLRVRGHDVSPTDTFTLALNSYRQGGGGGYSMVQGAPVVYDRDENIRDLIADELRRLGTLRRQDFDASNWSFAPDSAARQVANLYRTPSPYAPRGSPVLRLVLTTDFHGAILPQPASWADGRIAGGAATLGAMIDSATAACDCPVLHLDGGDQMQGTLTSNLSFGRSTVAAFNAMGLDAAAIGNHDLDWTIDTLKARMAEANYPWLAANVYDSTVGGRPGWARPFAMLKADSLNVAVVGYITGETKRIVYAPNVAHLAFPAGYAAIKGVLDTVRALHPDITVIVAHAGATCSGSECRGEIIDLARAAPAGVIDAIVAGHTHRPVATEVNGIPIVEARANGTALGILDLSIGSSGNRHWRSQLLDVFADAVTPDPDVLDAFAPYAGSAMLLATRIVTELPLPLASPRGGGETALGNLIVDAQRAETGADIAITNNGGIRRALPKGAISYGMLYELQPFGNAMVVVTMRGADVRAMLEHAVAGAGPDAHVSGLTVTYDPSRPVGQRVMAARLANGAELRSGATYRVAVNDFMAKGGGDYQMFAGHPTRFTGRTDLAVLVDYLATQPRPLAVPSTDRFRRTRR